MSLRINKAITRLNEYIKGPKQTFIKRLKEFITNSRLITFQWKQIPKSK
jgi:hypothetical protein